MGRDDQRIELRNFDAVRDHNRNRQQLTGWAGVGGMGRGIVFRSVFGRFVRVMVGVVVCVVRMRVSAGVGVFVPMDDLR